MSAIRDEWIEAMREKIGRPNNEVITKQVIQDTILITKWLGYRYNGWNSFDGMINPNIIGWVDSTGKYVGRSLYDLKLYTNVSKIKETIKEIKSKGYKFDHDFNQTLEIMFKSKDNNDIYLARSIRDNIWNECVTFIKQYNAENFSRSASGSIRCESNI